MHKNRKMAWDTRTLVFLGLLAAMHVVLTRVFVIEIGSDYRISLGSVCTIMAGLWFGPVGGGVCGLVSDILGCILKGYAINPLITVAGVIWGVIPALMRFALVGKKTKKMAVLCVAVAITSVFSTLVFTTAGIAFINGGEFWVSAMALLPGRLAQWAIMTPIYCVLTCMLYFSPITNMVMNAAVRRVKDTAHA